MLKPSSKLKSTQTPAKPSSDSHPAANSARMQREPDEITYTTIYASKPLSSDQPCVSMNWLACDLCNKTFSTKRFKLDMSQPLVALGMSHPLVALERNLFQNVSARKANPASSTAVATPTQQAHSDRGSSCSLADSENGASKLIHEQDQSADSFDESSDESLSTSSVVPITGMVRVDLDSEIDDFPDRSPSPDVTCKRERSASPSFELESQSSAASGNARVEIDNTSASANEEAISCLSRRLREDASLSKRKSIECAHDVKKVWRMDYRRRSLEENHDLLCFYQQECLSSSAMFSVHMLMFIFREQDWGWESTCFEDWRMLRTVSKSVRQDCRRLEHCVAMAPMRHVLLCKPVLLCDMYYFYAPPSS